jgi:predicted transcriptional regulator
LTFIFKQDACIIKNDSGLPGKFRMSGSTLISVRVSEEMARRLSALAEATDRSKSYVAAQAIEEFLTLQEWQVKAIRKGLAEAGSGKLLSHKEALKRLAKWGRRGA